VQGLDFCVFGFVPFSEFANGIRSVRVAIFFRDCHFCEGFAAPVRLKNGVKS